MKLANSEFVCVLCEKTIEHSELIYKLIIGKSCLCHGCLADARLGRMVRGMPEGCGLYHHVGGYYTGRFEAEYSRGNVTPEEALEAARVRG